MHNISLDTQKLYKLRLKNKPKVHNNTKIRFLFANLTNGVTPLSFPRAVMKLKKNLRLHHVISVVVCVFLRNPFFLEWSQYQVICKKVILLLLLHISDEFCDVRRNGIFAYPRPARNFILWTCFFLYTSNTSESKKTYQISSFDFSQIALFIRNVANIVIEDWREWCNSSVEEMWEGMKK